MTPLNSPVTNFKYCTLYGKTENSNVATIFHYVCYTNQICCDHGNGCCPLRSTRIYYKSWCFWLFIFGTMLGLYLLCWYCKRLEKERQARVDEDHERSGPRILPPSFRSVEVNSVDHLLESLILSYRNRLASDQNRPTHNIDGMKLLSSIDPPPKYIDALKMPKPQKPSVVITTITESSCDEDISSITSQDNHDGSQSDNNFVVVVFDDDEDVPSYEEAIKKI